MIVDPYPQIENITTIYTDKKIINVDSSYWQRDRLVYYDADSKKKKRIIFSRIEALGLIDGRIVTLIPRDLENIKYIQLKKGEFFEPQTSLFVGDTLLLVKETIEDDNFKSIHISEIEFIEKSYQELNYWLSISTAIMLMPLVFIAIYAIEVSSTEYPFGY